MRITTREFENRDRELLGQVYDLYWSGIFREKLTRKMEEFLTHSEKAQVENVHYSIAESEGELLGAVSWRICPEPMKKYAKKNNPIEIYILAVKNKGAGIGTRLMEIALSDAKNLGYNEAVLYNSDSHDEARGFYKHIGFASAGSASAPDGEMGEAFTLTF